ncbi:MAG: aspartate kinase [bacterium]|nr:aspartate kinase [bacterium]
MIEHDRLVVAKFGGSSLADAQRIENAAEIVRSSHNRQFIVVSAPGKRFPEDEKVTDLLLETNRLAVEGLPFDQAFEKVADRFSSIGRQLECHSVLGWLEEVHKGLGTHRGEDWVASRGEWLMAQVFASFLDGSFVDATSLIRLRQDGKIDSLSYDLISQQLTPNSVHYVIPGFYGLGPSGAIQTFARGGTDITGAIIAKGVNASVYENWTDVDGLRAADPRLIDNPKIIDKITYKEMRELGYRGADVLQRDSILPVFEAGIPINIRNTFNPDHPGTTISRERKISNGEGIVGIAGRSGFAAIQIEKFGMNEEYGIGGKIFDVFRQYDLPFENTPMGLDEMSVIVTEKELNGKEQELAAALTKAVEPTDIRILRNLGLICLVGEGIRKGIDRITSEFSSALADANISIRTLSYGTSGNNIVVGVDGDNVPLAIRSIYRALL